MSPRLHIAGIRVSVIMLAGCGLLLRGCTTNPPVTPEHPVPATGRICVTANVAEAKIFLDGLDTDRLTPDTITAAVGAHRLGVRKEGFTSEDRTVRVGADSLTHVHVDLKEAMQRIVLIEDFSNVSCNPCVISNLILNSVSSVTYGPSKVAVVRYATNFPSPSDPFYVANRADCNARMAYYQILAAPTTIVDGINRPASTDSTAVKSAVDAALLSPARFSIRVSDSVAAGVYTVTAAVQTLDSAGLDWGNLVVHTIVTEAEITYAVPPGSNGETRFTDVMRAMLPSSAGEPLQPAGNGATTWYTRAVPIDAAWRSDRLRSIVFIQHARTRAVFQSASSIE